MRWTRKATTEWASTSQSGKGRWPDVNAGRNVYLPDGGAEARVCPGAERAISETDRLGRVVLVGLFSPGENE